MKKKKVWPHVGMRIFKSAIGVLLVFVIYILRGQRGAPFYTALSVLWCMQPDVIQAKQKAFQRATGTMIGAFFGLVSILIDYYILGGKHEILRYLMIAGMIIPVLYVTVLLNKKNASYFSCVVFLSVAIMHLSDDNPYLFVFNRVLDTMIGIGLAYMVNTIHIPRRRRNDLLFIAALDEVLLDQEEKMTPYSQFELNRMLNEGAQFTLVTMRPPAALIPVLQGVRIQLPVIVMDGAVLYDVKQNRVIKKYAMSLEETYKLLDFCHEKGFHCFANVIVEDSVMIYYDTFQNSVEQAIYNTLRVSPYRNYVKGTHQLLGDPVYLMLIDQCERIEELYKALEAAGYAQDYKILKYASTDYPGYMYIKIYHRLATRANMVKALEALTGIHAVVMLEEQSCDGLMRRGDCNKIVRHLKRAYEPYFFQKD